MNTLHKPLPSPISGKSLRRRGVERGKSAFSLIELLVTIAIILILAGLAFKALRGLQSSARQVQCTANLRTIGTAIHAFSIEHKGLLPGPQFERIGFNASNLTFRLRPYLDNVGDTSLEKLWTCPANSGMNGRNKARAFAQRFSGYLAHYPFFGYEAKPPAADLRAYTLQKIREEYAPIQRWLLIDIDFWNYPSEDGVGGRYSPVHRDGRNVLWVDGSVEWVKSKQGVRP